MAKQAKCDRCKVQWFIKIMDQTPLKDLACSKCGGPVTRVYKQCKYKALAGEPVLRVRRGLSNEDVLRKRASKVTYQGSRDDPPLVLTVWKYHPRERRRLLPTESQKVYNHSPDGFEWGYEGSGPAQLALALLLDATFDPEISVALHQPFKREFVATWGDTWQISAKEIYEWAKAEHLKHLYKGKRIELLSMPADPAPIAGGSCGECWDIDAAGNLLVAWENGRTLSLIPGVDSFRVVNEGGVPCAEE